MGIKTGGIEGNITEYTEFIINGEAGEGAKPGPKGP